MTTESHKRFHQDFADNLAGTIRDRILGAKPVELLSDRDSKRVELVEDVNGNRFVRRSYQQRFVNRIEGHRLTFEEAWNGMQSMFQGAGLDIVPGFMMRLKPENDRQPAVVAVSEYLENARPVNEASVEQRIKLAAGLGELPLVSDNLIIKLEMYQDDMFHVGQTKDGERIFLTDVDPYVLNDKRIDRDFTYSRYIKRISELLAKWSNNDEEREVLISEFLTAVNPVIDELGEENALDTLFAISHAIALRDGYDPSLLQY